MTPHRLYYYPYASFTDQQLPLLKVAAVWFDELVILDPLGANLNTIGVEPRVSQALQLLQREGILRVVDPASVLQTYESPMAAAIRADLADPAFLQLCQSHTQATGYQRWTLSLAKVPQDLQADQALRHLLGDFARSVAGESSRYLEAAGTNPADVIAFAETGQAYNETRPGSDGPVEYRTTDLPLALGEAVMVNHALFAGLLQAGATPISDDPFHSQALALKLARALQDPAVQQAQAIHARQQKLDRWQPARCWMPSSACRCLSIPHLGADPRLSPRPQRRPETSEASLCHVGAADSPGTLDCRFRRRT